MLALGASRPLQDADLYDLSEEDTARSSVKIFQSAWEAEQARTQKLIEKGSTANLFVQELAKLQQRPPKLFKAFRAVHWKFFCLSGFLYAISAGQFLSQLRACHRVHVLFRVQRRSLVVPRF